MACQLISFLSLSCLLKNTFCLHGLCSSPLRSVLSLLVKDNIQWIISFPIFLKALATFSNSWGSSRCPSINIQIFLPSSPLTHFLLQIPSRKVGKLRYVQWTGNTTTCGAYELCQGNGWLRTSEYGPCFKQCSWKHVRSIIWTVTIHRIPGKSQALILLSCLQMQIKTCVLIKLHRKSNYER